MPELPNVVTGETIESDWGNDIRDRTIQRYANVTERTALHPMPTEGDLAYMEDTNRITYFDGGAWVVLALDPILTDAIANGAISTDKLADGAVTPTKLAASVAQNLVAVGGEMDATSGALTSSFVDKAAVTFTKPAAWGSYRLMAWGFALMASAAGSAEARLEIGASAGTAVAPGSSTPQAGLFHKVDSSTASQVVAVACRALAGSCQHQHSYVAYMAIRLT